MSEPHTQQTYEELSAVIASGRSVHALLDPAPTNELVLRSYLDTVGTISHPEQDELKVSLTVSSEQAAEAQRLWDGAILSRDGEKLTVSWHGLIALDLLGGACELLGLSNKEASHAATYRHWCSKVSCFEPSSTVGRTSAQQPNGFPAEMRVKRLLPEAVIPSKQRISDSGYDVTLLYEKKRVGNVVLYGTGLVVEPPFGWYFDVVPRSSIIKLGYLLANSVGVIDRAYRGELFVPLIKNDTEAPELALPQRVVQLIPRPIVHFPVVEVADLSQSVRGERGFGSSGR